MCWCYWKIKSNNEKILKIYNEGKESAKKFIESNKNRYVIKREGFEIYFYDTKKEKNLEISKICKKLNRLEYYKGICFD